MNPALVSLMRAHVYFPANRWSFEEVRKVGQAQWRAETDPGLMRFLGAFKNNCHLKLVFKIQVPCLQLTDPDLPSKL